MIRLYSKPDNYNTLMEDLAPGADGVLDACLYNAQCYINSSYSSLAQEVQEDIMQETAIGVIRAIDRYQPEKGVTFAAYMHTSTKWAAAKAYREVTGDFQVSASVQREASKFHKQKEEAEYMMGRSLSVEEAAEIYGCKKSTAEHYTRIKNGIQATLNAQNENGNSAIDNLAGKEDVEAAAISDGHIIEKLVNAMSGENQFIVKAYLECCGQKGGKKKFVEKCQKKGIKKARAINTVNLFRRMVETQAGHNNCT